MSIISLNNLNINQGEQNLVRNVNFSIEKCEILALVGESGSGKTLTALALMNLLPGSLTASGNDLKLIRGKEIAMIFQEPMTSLNPLHNIGKQIGEAIKIHNPKITKTQITAKVQSLLGDVGLEKLQTRLDAYPHQLSGGERQRVMIAMAIANNPQILVADEPTTALDVTVQAQILKLLAKIRADSGMAILLITHDLAIVKQIADRIAVMYKGEIVEIGNTKEIFANPKHTYTQKLLALQKAKPLTTPPQGLEKVIECKNLTLDFASDNAIFSFKKTYKTVLHDINLSLGKAVTLGIVGESGSGKTSLALALLKLSKSSGQIFWNNQSVEDLPQNQIRKLRRNVQIVFQDPFSSLNPRINIGDIIREGIDVHEANLSLEQRNQKVDAILQEVGLSPDMKQRYPHEFSGGQRQRISIARALILQPKLIILDEPTSALDISVQTQILNLLIDLQNKYGLSYIFISHDLRTIRAISHNVIVLKNGHIVESGSNSQIFDNPRHEYTVSLLKAANLQQ